MREQHELLVKLGLNEEQATAFLQSTATILSDYIRRDLSNQFIKDLVNILITR